MGPRVVPFAPAHRAAVRDLLAQHGWEEPLVEDELGELDWASEEPVEACAFTAIEDGELVGYARARFHHRTRLVEVLALAVRPDRQRRGIGSLLLAAVERAARGWGARGVYAETPVTNAGGRAFYEARGYRCAYVMPRYHADGLDGVTYQRFFD